MSKIKKLDSTIFNKIAAGEVIEKPASVVKELVENAIDARADNISIFIKEGGLDEITVSDNGHGIQKEDLPTAFLPHATSKITTAEDLYSIASLGFRGEALASIASVARIKIRSRYYQEDGGNFLSIDAGNIQSFESYGMNSGTIISVNNLFFNTPARLKFLKKPRYEENDITALVTKFVLANPSIRFELTNEKGTLVASEGRGLASAVLSIFGKDADNMLPINKTIKDISIKGYISNTNFYKGNKLQQTVILNGRIINNITIATAIHNAYSLFLMKRNYPVVVINIDMPYEDVDVNVHPSKTDVRFVDSNKVFKILYSVIKEALEQSTRDKAINISSEYKEKINADTSPDSSQAQSKPIPTQRPTITQSTIFDRIGSFESVAETDSGIQTKIRSIFDNLASKELSSDSTISSINTPQKMEDSNYEKATNYDIDSSEYKIIGQVFGTYIMIEYLDDLILIDQHAAAERILFDKIVKEYNSNNLAVQPLLIPYIFTVSAAEQNILSEQLESLADIGIEIEDFGNNSYKVNALPQILVGMDIKGLINLILNDKANVTAPIRDRLMLYACKSAIKGNTVLSTENIRLLINNLFEKNIPDSCPHGRPVYIKISKLELSKKFKRIV